MKTQIATDNHVCVIVIKQIRASAKTVQRQNRSAPKPFSAKTVQRQNNPAPNSRSQNGGAK